ncbi:hypothetical protein GCM10012286_45680 [Streptomyces lasiicapitis]|uniref:DUF2256 domain-containing protein n=1 Tax=Streptomyces lasiicapitis TaxID=1923961 RepID=A0ABQ2MAA4_9ACTN|nr:hypothetical protein GCM10012286_45680 [Streptomyces lasiicapitis]
MTGHAWPELVWTAWTGRSERFLGTCGKRCEKGWGTASDLRRREQKRSSKSDAEKVQLPPLGNIDRRTAMEA